MPAPAGWRIAWPGQGIYYIQNWDSLGKPGQNSINLLIIGACTSWLENDLARSGYMLYAKLGFSGKARGEIA